MPEETIKNRPPAIRRDLVGEMVHLQVLPRTGPGEVDPTRMAIFDGRLTALYHDLETEKIEFAMEGLGRWTVNLSEQSFEMYSLTSED